MLENNQAHYDDEIDIFEVLETLWAGKFVVLASTLLPLLASFGWVQFSTPTFEVKATYSIHTGPMAIYHNGVCQREDCRKNIVASRIVSLSDGDWRSVDGGSALALTTEAPKTVAAYQESLAELNQTLSVAFLKEAKTEVDIIQNEISGPLQQTEVIASSLLAAKRALFSLEQKGAPLVFGPIFINSVERISLSTLVALALIGAVAGSGFVLLRKAFRDRQIRNGEGH